MTFPFWGLDRSRHPTRRRGVNALGSILCAASRGTRKHDQPRAKEALALISTGLSTHAVVQRSPTMPLACLVESAPSSTSSNSNHTEFSSMCWLLAASIIIGIKTIPDTSKSDWMSKLAPYLIMMILNGVARKDLSRWRPCSKSAVIDEYSRLASVFTGTWQVATSQWRR